MTYVEAKEAQMGGGRGGEEEAHLYLFGISSWSISSLLDWRTAHDNAGKWKINKRQFYVVFKYLNQPCTYV